MAALTPEEAEYYPTPAWCVRRMSEAIPFAPTRVWLDPCVGNAAIPRAMGTAWSAWVTVDIRDTGFADVIGDYTRHMPQVHSIRFDVCVMNPPFSKALAFAQKALTHCGQVVMLQRLNWLASEDRREWISANPPGVHVLPNRPSFTGDGKTDGADYAWFTWGVAPGVHVLGNTSIAERRADEAAAVGRHKGPEQVELFA